MTQHIQRLFLFGFLLFLSACSSTPGLSANGTLQSCSGYSHCYYSNADNESKIIESLSYEGAEDQVILSASDVLESLGVSVDRISGSYLSGSMSLMGIPWVNVEFLASGGLIEMRYSAKLPFDFGQTEKTYLRVYAAFTGAEETAGQGRGSSRRRLPADYNE